MRAICETCSATQPPGWKAGDLCATCGAAVRRDVRCFWCARWTPAARFCRGCGAETVDDTLYGAARMLKDAGTDRFTVPKMLRDLDREQIENFTRIYQRHAITLVRHVDEVRFLERFLFDRRFSATLEDKLIPELPWPEERLATLEARPPSHAGGPSGDDLSTSRIIGETSPFPLTRSLAALARLRLSDWSAWQDARAAFDSREPHLRAEAALALSGWRTLRSVGAPRYLEREIVDELLKSPLRLEAGVRLALLGRRDEDLLRDALASSDPDVAFPAALALGDVGRLRSALGGDDLATIAAGCRLVELGVVAPVAEVLARSAPDVQASLVDALARRKGPVPEAEDALLAIVEKTDDARLRQRAAAALCRRLRPEWALRVARAARKDRAIFQCLLFDAAELPAATVADLIAWMVEGRLFTASQYGLETAAARGAIPDGLVPSLFPRADEATRRELLRLAESQLGARGDEALHRFVMSVVFGPHPAATRAAAWWVLSRWYRRGDDIRGEGPFRLEVASIERFFGSTRELIPRLTAVVRDAPTLREVGLFDFLAHLFSTAGPATVPAFLAEEAATHDLIRAIVEALRGDFWPYLLDAMLRFLGLVGVHARWRDEAIAGIEATGRHGSYHRETALRTLRLSAHGLPDEPAWPALPDDFVPARFGDASPETRLLLLRVAEQQLIRRPAEPLARFLLTVARGPFDAATTLRAREIFKERAPRELRDLPIQ